MLEWDNRMQNTNSVKILKTVIPFFDVAVGESIDMEGLFGAIRPFTRGKERRMVDMLLQFFQMRRMIEMVQMVQSIQQLSAVSSQSEGERTKDKDASLEDDKPEGIDVPLEDKKPEEIDGLSENKENRSTSGKSGNGFGSPTSMMEVLKTMVPPEQQENMEMISAMMSMMSMNSEKDGGKNGSEII